VAGEIKVYTEDDHLNGVNDNIKEIYQTVKARILDLGNDIQIKSNKKYIAFRRKHNFAAIKIRKSLLKLKLLIKKSELNDPLNKAKDIGERLTEIDIKEPNDIQYVLPFIQYTVVCIVDR
jgi:predicted transport protein